MKNSKELTRQKTCGSGIVNKIKICEDIMDDLKVRLRLAFDKKDVQETYKSETYKT